MNEELFAIASADAPHFRWLSATPLRKVTDALQAKEKHCARFVGGCVRDSLVGQTPKDFDVATTLTPAEVVDALKSAGLKWAPTGLDHGTVTGIADHVGVEITTLRADVSTDGRRATVAFTRDWAVDARRRDFRLNALYLTPEGMLFDPVGGIDDARAGRVRFIGSPEERLREDYLRILRFFRFSARFSGAFDAEGLAACAALREGLRKLSAERIGDEFARILALPRAALAVDAMAATGVLAEVWPAGADRGALALLKERAPDAPAPLGLAALWGEAGEGIDARLRLSNEQSERRKAALAASSVLATVASEKDAKAALYRAGAEAFADGVLVLTSRVRTAAPSWHDLPRRWQAPAFPYSGKDVIAHGVSPGPRVSTVLKAVENNWIEEGFPPADRAQQLLELAIARTR
jgi:poly(A) polymerase